MLNNSHILLYINTNSNFAVLCTTYIMMLSFIVYSLSARIIIYFIDYINEKALEKKRTCMDNSDITYPKKK